MGSVMPILEEVSSTLETSEEDVNYTRNEWRRCKLHSKRVKKICFQVAVPLSDVLIIVFGYDSQDYINEAYKYSLVVDTESEEVTYSRIWVLRGYRNLQSYLSTTML